MDGKYIHLYIFWPLWVQHSSLSDSAGFVGKRTPKKRVGSITDIKQIIKLFNKFSEIYPVT